MDNDPKKKNSKPKKGKGKKKPAKDDPVSKKKPIPSDPDKEDKALAKKKSNRSNKSGDEKKLEPAKGVVVGEPVSAYGSPLDSTAVKFEDETDTKRGKRKKDADKEESKKAGDEITDNDVVRMYKLARTLYWMSFATTMFHAIIMLTLFLLVMIPLVLFLSFGMIAGGTFRWQLCWANVVFYGLAFILHIVTMAIMPDPGIIALSVLFMIYDILVILLSIYVGKLLKRIPTVIEFHALREKYNICCCEC
jgi:hypothetical protein